MGVEEVRSYARAAYAQGWAVSGGPMTQRVQAGCLAVMDMCESRWNEPDIIEVAIHLGKLEGVWAKIFARRFALMDKLTVQTQQTWRSVTKQLDVAGVLEVLAQQFGLVESKEDDERAKRDRARAAARDAVNRLLQWLPGTPEWQALRNELRDAILSGRAEGFADALAIAGLEAHTVSFDFDLAFQHAYDALENLGETWAQGDAWLERMLGRAADEFTRTIGDLVASEAEYSQLLAAGLDVLQATTADEDIVSFIIDWAMSAGMSQGALDLYKSENVEKVTWMTAGDGRVCILCEQHGIDSPFPIMDFPEMPAHPRCRCVASAEFDVTPDYSAFFSG